MTAFSIRNSVAVWVYIVLQEVPSRGPIPWSSSCTGTPPAMDAGIGFELAM